MFTMKDAVPRRVWRMTSDSPAGEYLELVPKAASAAGAEPRVRAESSMAASPLATTQRVAPQSTVPAALSATQETFRDAPAPPEQRFSGRPTSRTGSRRVSTCCQGFRSATSATPSRAESSKNCSGPFRRPSSPSAGT